MLHENWRYLALHSTDYFAHTGCERLRPNPTIPEERRLSDRSFIDGPTDNADLSANGIKVSSPTERATEARTMSGPICRSFDDHF